MEIKILTKPIQSGKTHDGIVSRANISYQKGRLPIIILPSNILLQNQVSKRIVAGVNLDFLGDVKCITEEERELIRNNPRIFRKSNIGRFDSGADKIQKLRNITETRERLNTGSIKCLIVIFNKNGISKLMELVSNMQENRIDFIIDEFHTFMAKSGSTRNVLFSDLLSLKHSNPNWSVTGLSATVTSMSGVQYENYKLKTDTLQTPESYCGYEKCVKVIKKGIVNIMKDIIADGNLFGGTTVMCHSGNTTSKHRAVSRIWASECKEKGIQIDKIGSLLVNGNGYVLYDSDQHVIKQFSKVSRKELWEIIKICKEYTPFLGIFGDRCITQGITCQKCDETNNVRINHMIVLEFGKKFRNMTNILQKLGRIFTNDTTGDNTPRVIWFETIENKEKMDKAFNIETDIQQSDKFLQDILICESSGRIAVNIQPDPVVIIENPEDIGKFENCGVCFEEKPLKMFYRCGGCRKREICNSCNRRVKKCPFCRYVY